MERIDTRETIETPEGVSFHIHPAGPIPRIQAAVVDLVVRGAIIMGLAMCLGPFGNFGAGALLIAFFAVNWGYPIYFEMFHRGMTPGKRIFDLQVRSADGTPINWRGSVLRNLLRTVDFLPFGYVGGICVLTASRRFQRLGDLAADTLVCYRRDQAMPDADAVPDVRPARASRRLRLDEQRAVVRFAVRSQRWNDDRNRELAAIVEPLTETADADEGVERLRRLASGIVHGVSDPP